MFGIQNNQTASNENSSKEGVDPKKIRTFLPYDAGQNKKALFQKQQSPLSSEKLNPNEPIIQKNFSVDIENNVGNGSSSASHTSPASSSPFYTPEQASLSKTETPQNTFPPKNTPPAFKDTSFSEIKNVTQTNIPPQKTDSPKENERFKSSFQPAPKKEDVQNGDRLFVRDESSQQTGNTPSSNTFSFFQKKLFFATSLLLLCAFASFGGYSYWKTQSIPLPQEEIPVIVGTPTNSVQKKPTDPAPTDKKIAKSLILNNSQGKTVLTELQKTAKDLLAYPNNAVFEFFFVNEEKNYEILSEKDLLQQLAIAFPEKFSNLIQMTNEGRVYFVKNGSDVRLVLSVPTLSRENASSLFLASEESLLRTVEPLYLSQTSLENNLSRFSNQAYREYAIRYYNINTEKNYSLDYAFRRDTLYLATSKQSLRDALDFLDGIGQ